MPRRRISQGRPTPEAARLLAEARAAYLRAADLRENMPTPLGWYPQPDAEVDSSNGQPDDMGKAPA